MLHATYNTYARIHLSLLFDILQVPETEDESTAPPDFLEFSDLLISGQRIADETKKTHFFTWKGYKACISSELPKFTTKELSRRFKLAMASIQKEGNKEFFESSQMSSSGRSTSSSSSCSRGSSSLLSDDVSTEVTQVPETQLPGDIMPPPLTPPPTKQSKLSLSLKKKTSEAFAVPEQRCQGNRPEMEVQTQQDDDDIFSMSILDQGDTQKGEKEKNSVMNTGTNETTINALQVIYSNDI